MIRYALFTSHIFSVIFYYRNYAFTRASLSWMQKLLTNYLMISDALLEDLQTSVSRSTTPSRGGRALSPQVEYRVAANPTKIVSEGRWVDFDILDFKQK